MINHNYLDRLLVLVGERYSNTFKEMLIALLHLDPDVRIKADHLYSEYLAPIEKDIESFDRSWLRLV